MRSYTLPTGDLKLAANEPVKGGAGGLEAIVTITKQLQWDG